jgi:gliding motility-associated-like protein
MGKRYFGWLFLLVALQVEAHIADCFTKPIISISKTGRPSVVATNTVCQDSLVQLNLTNFTKGSTFQWSLNNIPISNASDSVFVVNKNLGGVYGCVVKNLQVCPEVLQPDPITVVFRARPNVSVSMGNPTGTPCVDGFVKLTASTTEMGRLTYQWLRENQPILSANSNTYDAVDTGVYTLRFTDANGCSHVSASINVISNTPPKVDLRASKGGFCKGESVLLTATHGRTFLYQWLRDGQPINEPVNGSPNALNASKAGSYSVRATAPNGCSTESIPINILQYDDPVVAIATTGNQLCPGASLQLTATGTKLKSFQWIANGQNSVGDTNKMFIATKAGNYAVAVIDSNGCKAMSSLTNLEMVTKITVKLDSVQNFCGTAFVPVVLKGTPAGGVFTGNGVDNATFDPKLAGVGQHTITYTVTGNLSCLNGEAKQIVIIGSPPTLDLGADRDLRKGSSITLNADLGADYTYSWTPPVGIDGPNSAQPVFSPERTTTYHVVAKQASGCSAEDSITIRVFAGVYIPDVFTPNNDGQNDTWELKGLEEYPEAEVTVFDRWGHAVFYNKGSYQKPFDGNTLPAGSYVYVIRSEPAGYVFRGKLLLIR